MAVVLVLGIHIAWILVDAGRQKRMLAELEAGGIRRRSAKTPRSAGQKRKKKK